MDFISLLANIAQIFSVIWMLLFGGKAISEILQRRAYSSRPYTIRPSILLNVVLAFLVLLLSSALWFKLNSASGTTHVAPGTILYRADWSKGLNGWTQAPGEYGDNWQVINGQLTSGNNATNNGIFLAPAHLQGVANYLVEIRMKIVSTVAYVPTHVQANPRGVVSSFQPLSGCPSFAIIVRYTDSDHFRIGGDCFLSNPSGGFHVGDSNGMPIDSSWHIYSCQAKQDKYVFTIENIPVSHFAEGDMPDPHVDTSQAGQVGLTVGGMQVSISSFTVTAL